MLIPSLRALELIEGLMPGVIKKQSPAIHTIHQQLLKRPRIEEYLKSKKRFEQITLSPNETLERKKQAVAEFVL